MPGPKKKNLREETGRLISAALWNKQHEPTYRGGDARSDAVLDQQRAGPIERVEDKPVAVEDLPVYYEGQRPSGARVTPTIRVEDLPMEQGPPLPPPAPPSEPATASEQEPQYPPAQTVAAPTASEAADNLHEEGVRAFRAGDIDTAYELFKAAYAEDPGRGSLANAAFAAESRGDMDDAMQLYVQLLQKAMAAGDKQRMEDARAGIANVVRRQQAQSGRTSAPSPQRAERGY